MKPIGALSIVVLGVAATLAGAAPSSAPDQRRSGFAAMSPALRAMQADETSNPGTLWVREGEALWATKVGPDDRSCATCHGDATTSMRGVAARYPAFDEAGGAPMTLAGRIDSCRTKHQRMTRLDRENDTLLALEAFVGRQSRDLPIAPPTDARLDPYRLRGEAIYRRRMGQLDLACAQCHDANAGRRLGGSVIPEAHPTGYPIYRLEWQSLGSLTRRVRGCMIGVRAEPFDDDAVELVELELYLEQRAAGMPVETPAVRPEESTMQLVHAWPGVVLLMVAAAAAGQTAVAPASAADSHVRSLAATCAACHGTDGEAVSGGAMVALAGYPAPALGAQMRAFRDGTRTATVMHQIAKGYTDQQIEALAAWFAARPAVRP